MATPYDTGLMSDLLRNQNMFAPQRPNPMNVMGQALIASGDKPLGQLGSTLVSSTAAEEDRRRKALESARRDHVLNRYYEQQGSQGDERNRILKFRAETDRMKALAPEAIDYRDLSEGGFKTLSEMGSLARNAKGILEQFRPEYTQRLGKFSIGVLSNIPNLLARTAPGLVDQDTRDAANWWAQWRQLVTLPERNEKFGATLTPNEQRAFKEAEMIEPSMDAPQLTQRMSQIASIIAAKTEEMREARLAAGYDPSVIDPLLDINLANPQGGTDQSDGFSIDTSNRAKPFSGTTPKKPGNYTIQGLNGVQIPIKIVE